ncbi:MAG TPA: hypothetical protein PK177_02390 [Burkholderiaceae bacterium]|nr:hypothetical protein [Burkholderiaceae bacterium]
MDTDSVPRGDMENYLHRVVGIYPTVEEALAARQQLLDQGVPATNVHLFEPGRVGAGSAPSRLPEADSDDVLKEILRESAIGTAVGTAAGAVGTAALAVAGVSLFVASPVIAPLAMIGWGAGLGGLVGAATATLGRKGDVADLVRDALKSGHVVLLAHASDEAQTALMRMVIGDSMIEAGIGDHAPG